MFQILFILSLLFAGCQGPRATHGTEVVRMHIVDRNGLTETISSPKKLERFKMVDFEQHQPYQKVLRIYSANERGDISSKLTSYYPNGQIKELLEVVNSRAFGLYQEWHANGATKLKARVIGGIADLNEAAKLSWIFDGVSEAFDDQGALLARIFYEKGILANSALHFHKNGKIWKQIPYEKGLIHGIMEVFYSDGRLLQSTHYVKGLKTGECKRFWPDGICNYVETWREDRLQSGRYYDHLQTLVCQVDQGTGRKAIFNEASLIQTIEYRYGEPRGEVCIFDKDGLVIHTYFLENGLKEGPETYYYKLWDREQQAWDLFPKISISWQMGNIQGLVKTWYENRVLESQKEMADNNKHGVLTAWYIDGSLMMIEEYDQGKLVRGEYLRFKDGTAVSRVSKGEGTATLFDPKGNLIRKVSYKDGYPVE
ncbi:MAG: conserved putative secreted protein [Chlamydiales bacterium]|jgi:antitoxin component YwqK of YwqJK toxin-antitoxin module|nr:conserved putative secreted protein [Chlamydiales bacterium]